MIRVLVFQAKKPESSDHTNRPLELEAQPQNRMQKASPLPPAL